MLAALSMVRAKCLVWDWGADELGDFLGESEIDLGETVAGEALVDDGVVAVVQFEAEGLLDVDLLVLGERVVEELSLVVVLAELGAQAALLDTVQFRRVGREATLFYWCGWSGLKPVRPVVDSALGDAVAFGAVSVVVQNGADGAVDGDFFPVDAQSTDLSVEVGEVTALEKRVVTEVNAGDDVAGAEGDLLGLREELVDVAVQFQFADHAQRHELLGPDLRRVENVKFEVILFLLRDDLDGEVPFRVCAVINGLHEILAMEIGVLASQFQSLVPHQRVHSQVGDEMELDKMALSFLVDETECVDTETLHHTV